MRSGFVGLIGRPNVGKSTLMNAIVGKKVAITSSKPQTTRNMIQGIYNDADTQIVFVDTPGIHKPNHKFGQYLNEEAYYSVQDVDIVLVLVDATQELGTGDQFVIDKIKEVQKPVFLVINKIDQMARDQLLPKIEAYQKLFAFTEIIPVSALKRENVDHLVDVLKRYLPDQVRYYEEGQVTNQSLSFLVSELVREQVFVLTEEEVPHSITCMTEHMEKSRTGFLIRVNIIVDRDSLKKIVIGKSGSKIKQIGIRSRKEIERLVDCPVYLELFVKTIKKWRDKETALKQLGFHQLEE